MCVMSVLRMLYKGKWLADFASHFPLYIESIFYLLLLLGALN